MLANEAAIAWAAGLFEGEGCIFLRINKEKGKYYPHLSLSMCDEDVVKKFAITVDRPNITGPYYCKSQPLWKPRYQWFCGKKKDVIRILVSFLPYFGERRAYHALNALDMYDSIYTKNELFLLNHDCNAHTTWTN